MKRKTWKPFFPKLTVVLIVGFVLFTFCFLNIPAQRRVRVYNRFDHNTPAHDRQSCNECHKIPTGLSSAETASGENYRYPDITDYPDHDACLNCHRQQFFRGARPAICSICHTKVSPRDKARFTFPKANQATEFSINFPHDRHQDIFAKQTQPSMRNKNVAVMHFINAKLTTFANFQDDDQNIYNCAICHAPATAKTYITKPRIPQTGLIAVPHKEKFPDAEFLKKKADEHAKAREAVKDFPDYTVVGHFKTVPNGHDSCFNCHYSQQRPTRNECGECHIPKFNRSDIIERFSLKFSHDEIAIAEVTKTVVEEGKEVQKTIKTIDYPHQRECAFCHVRITQSSDLRLLEPDVPIFTCGNNCHNDNVENEISQLRDKKISCSYCHSEYIGSRPVPSSHRNLK